MGRKGYRGSITVFLSLTCILFLALICTAVESARLQGARAQAANITGMGCYSVLGEFETQLLEEYEIFSVDGAYGNGSFQIQKVNGRLESFLDYNANPKKDLFSVWCFDPWNLGLEDSKVTEYALLTDEKGEPFYQQAVAYMKANAAALSIEKLLEYQEDTTQLQNWQEEYEKKKKESDRQLKELETAKQEKENQLESEAEENGTSVAVPEKKNPLKEIVKLQRKSVLEVVTGGRQVSGKKVSAGSLPSKRVTGRGKMKVEKTFGGIVDNALFREYLVRYFPNYLSGEEEGALDYQLEYILGGKASDRENLKQVVTKLLLLREGMNYLYCVQDYEMSWQAGSLAAALTGFLGIPALTAATKQALLLAWAYGESLIDVRTLLDGGKVPVSKDRSTWKLSLENLGQIAAILEQGNPGSANGLAYSEYLRILLNMGNLSQQRMRALDMLQCNLRRREGCGNFKAENCIVGIRMETEWSCRPVFFSVAQAFLGIRGKGITVRQEASMAY